MKIKTLFASLFLLAGLAFGQSQFSGPGGGNGSANLPAGTAGNPLINTNGSTGYGTSPLWVDGSALTGANSNDWCDKVRKQLSNMSTGTSAVLDMSALSGAQNCAVDPTIDLIGAGMQPAKTLTVLVNSNLVLTTNAPITQMTQIKLKGMGGPVGANNVGAQIIAGASFPATYTGGGTITATDAGTTGGSGSTSYSVVVTFSSTVGTNIVPGEQFVACNTGPTLAYYGLSCGATAAAHPWSGTVQSVSGTTATIITSQAVTANTSAYNFVAFGAIINHGDGSGISGQAGNFDAETVGFTIDCNGVAGCVPFYNKNSQNHSKFYGNTLHPSNNAGAIIDGPGAQQSSFYDNFIVGQTGKCTVNTVGLIIRSSTATPEPFYNNQIVLTQCGANGVNTGVMIDAPVWMYASKIFTNSTSAIASSSAILLGSATACPVVCAGPPSSVTMSHIGPGINFASYANYGVNVGTNTSPKSYTIEDIESSSGAQVTDILNDQNTSCTIPQATENQISHYEVNQAGAISNSTSGVTGCTNNNALTANTLTATGGISTGAAIPSANSITGLNAIKDTNGNTIVGLTATASAIDYLAVTNAATANPATVTLTATGTDSNINVNLVSKGTGTVQCNGASCGGSSYDPTVLTGYARLWDFCSQSNSGGYDWQGNAISGGSVTPKNAPAWPDFCGWQIITGTTNGGGDAIAMGDTFTIGNHLFPPLGANTGWTYTIRMSVSATTAVQVYAGFVANSFAGVVPPASWFGVRFDTVNSMTAFQGEACNASTCTSTANLATVDTLYHTYKFRSTVAGTILFSVDGGTELSVAANVPTGNLTPFVEILGTGTTRTLTVGPIAFNIPTGTLSR